MRTFQNFEESIGANNPNLNILDYFKNCLKHTIFPYSICVFFVLSYSSFSFSFILLSFFLPLCYPISFFSSSFIFLSSSSSFSLFSSSSSNSHSFSLLFLLCLNGFTCLDKWHLLVVQSHAIHFASLYQYAFFCSFNL